MALNVAFLWHFHQPMYSDPQNDSFLLPWVRLHSTKDYYPMGLIVRETGCPVTVNFVPSLVLQIEEYVAGKTDVHEDISRIPAADVSSDDLDFMLDHFFSCNPAVMIYPHSRYRELYMQRRPGKVSARDVASRFKPQDIRDLQVWWNLAWMHRRLGGEFPLIAELVAKDHGFTEDDKNALLDLFRPIMAGIIPFYRQLWDDGLVEITTTPFYHPILPLLCDAESAREAMPTVQLPEKWERVPEDAELQLVRARDFMRERFGRVPDGLWPSEGSVSSETLSIASSVGFKYAATDEAILAGSIHRKVRDEYGRPKVDLLYRPYLYSRDGHDIALFFRDRELSDLIGFSYQMAEEQNGADDLLTRLANLAGRSNDGAIVSIMLDGENAWEHYRNQGEGFLGRVYSGLLSAGNLAPVTFGRYLAEGHMPAADTVLPRVAAGSWVDGNFAIWIGAEQDRRAWNILFDARRAVVEAGGAPEAMEEIYIAEGSDWFWWFGPDRTSYDDATFDAIFRKHIMAAYQKAGKPVPAFLDAPIGAGAIKGHEPPHGIVQAVVDGMVTDYFEWLAAGRVLPGAGGVIASSGGALLKALYYGFDRSVLFLRVDPADDVEIAGLTIAIVIPRERNLELEGAEEPGRFRIRDEVGRKVGTGRMKRILELGVPFGALGVSQGEEVGFLVKVKVVNTASEAAAVEEVRLPAEGILKVSVPEATYGLEDWSV
ncbi:MAG: alpha-amylase/alpha-mannosidase [Planctomycetes bacterium]|nr:alpha-amylase/alpha-mannosidase [Planctomycetota bacterium]